MFVSVSPADLRTVIALIAEVVECRTDGEHAACVRLASAIPDVDDAAFLVRWLETTRNEEG